MIELLQFSSCAQQPLVSLIASSHDTRLPLAFAILMRHARRALTEKKDQFTNGDRSEVDHHRLLSTGLPDPNDDRQQVARYAEQDARENTHLPNSPRDVHGGLVARQSRTELTGRVVHRSADEELVCIGSGAKANANGDERASSSDSEGRNERTLVALIDMITRAARPERKKNELVIYIRGSVRWRPSDL